MVGLILIQTVLYFSIVRAVSAPSEGTALTGQNKHEPNAFCHFDEKEQNAGGPPLHRPYNVDVNGTSECAKQKIRTSLFFYEYFLSQFQKSNNSYCISKRNFFSRKEKNYLPYKDFVYRKRNLLGIDDKSQVKISNSKRSLGFMRIPKPGKISQSSEKKREEKLTEVEDKRRKKDLKYVEINDELDINKGIKKLVEQIALENLRTEQPKPETEFAEPNEEFRYTVERPATVTRDSSAFFNRIFSFNKEHSNKNVTNDDRQVGSVPVNTVQAEDRIPEAHNGSYELLPSVRKPTRFTRNLRKRFIPRHTHHNKSKFRLKKKDDFGGEVNNLKKTFKKSKKFVPADKRKKRKGKIKNVPRRSESTSHDSKKEVKDNSKPKRHDDTTSSFKQLGLFKKSNSVKGHGKEKLTADPEKFMFYRKHPIGSLNEDGEKSDRGKDEKSNKLGIQINVRVPPRNGGKPSSNCTQDEKKFFKYELPNDENLTPFRYLKIRHALRNYLIHNDVWLPNRKEFLNDKREKRYGTSTSSKKCWKSAPLLCIPYIRKGQDEMLKQIMKSVQRMIEKPMPDKVEIFEKTKFKPCIKKEPDNSEKNCNNECPSGENTSSRTSKARTASEHKNRSYCTPPSMQCSPTPSAPFVPLPSPLSCPPCPPCPTPYIEYLPSPTPLPSTLPPQLPTHATYPPECPKCPSPTKHSKASTSSPKSVKCSPRPPQCPKCPSSSQCSKCSRHGSQCSTCPPCPTQCPVCPPCPPPLPPSLQNQSTTLSIYPTWSANSSSTFHFPFFTGSSTPSSSSSSSSLPKSSTMKFLSKLLHPSSTPRSTKTSTPCPTASTQCPTISSSTECSTISSSTECPTTSSTTECPTSSSTTEYTTTSSSSDFSSSSSSSSSTQCPTTSSTECLTTSSSTECPTTTSTQCLTKASSTPCPTSSTLCLTTTQCPTTSSHSLQLLSTTPSLKGELTTSLFSGDSSSSSTLSTSSFSISTIKKPKGFSTFAPFTTPELLSTILPITIPKSFSKTPYPKIPPFRPSPFSDLTALPFTSSTMFISRMPMTPSPNPNEGMVPNFPNDPTMMSPCITPAPLPTPPYFTPSPLALRHFFQTLQTGRPNHCSNYPPCGNPQCPIFTGNIAQMTTPTSYFSPTSYFINPLDSDSPPVLGQTLSHHYYSNRSHLQSNPAPSTANPGCWCISKPPNEQTEYFSFPDLPLTSPPDVMTSKFSHEGKVRHQGNQQSSYTQGPANQDGMAPLTLLRNNEPDWAPNFTSADSTEAIEFSMLENNQSRLSQNEKGFENLNENSKISDQSKHILFKNKPMSNEDYKTDKSMNRNFLSNKLLEYMQDNENLFKKITKARRHRLNSKFHHKPDMELPNYDLYERHPLVRSTEKNVRYHKYPLPWLFHQRAKKHSKKRHLKRKKREDHYNPSDEDSNYVNENYKDTYHDDSYSKDFQSVDSLHSSAEEKPFLEKDPNTTPLFFALFSELAKVVARPKTVPSNTNNENPVSHAKSAEKRKSSNFNIQNDTVSEYISRALDKNISLDTTLDTTDTTKTFQGDTEFTTISLGESTVRNSTLKCKVTIRRKKTTKEDSTGSTEEISTVPLISEPTTTPSGILEPTTCYCVPIGSSVTPPAIIKPCRPRKGKLLNSTLALPTTTELFSTSVGTDETLTSPFLEVVEEDQMPSTLKTANIVKGPKKVIVKPTPKTYTKVYPDSIGNELDSSEASTPKSDIVKKIPMHVFPISNTRLQLLAVCEGYLEVVKLIKAQNQSIEDGLDADLSRYCESIISQSFSLQSDKDMKMKKMEVIPTPAIFMGNVQSLKKHRSRFSPKIKRFSVYKPFKRSLKQLTSQELRDKIVVDILSSPIYKRELAAKTDMKKKKKAKIVSYKVHRRPKYKGKKFKKYPPNSDFSTENPRRFRRKGKKNDELLGKGIPEEQMKLLHLLRKRKRALLSWLFNSKDDQMKPDNTRETEYLDDEEYVTPDADLKEASGKITPKVDETIPHTTTNESSLVNPSMFPVYAKNYGYDKGGELREVEVLWRKVNEKTQEKKIFKNQSVLALLLATTKPLDKPEGPKPWDNVDLGDFNLETETKATSPKPAIMVGKLNATVATGKLAFNSSRKNDTQTIISKPDPSSIVGAPPNATTVSPNTTHKISHALAVAKDLFQEYIIEFLNYAVYILPIMFTLLFLFCCVCCFLQVLRDKKNRKKKKRKRRNKGTSDDDTDCDNSTDTESECKKKSKRKKQDKGKNNVENLEKKTSKTIWSVLRLNSGKPSSEFNDDNSQAEKKSFLWFLKGKKDEGKIEELPYTTLHELDEKAGTYGTVGGKKNKVLPDSDDQSGTVRQNSDRKKKKEDKSIMEEQNEATERRELIALLEELKKIEMEREEEKKKEQRSVYVQYMRQEEDNCFGGKGENRGKEAGKPRGPSFCQKHFPFDQGPAFHNYELYQDVGELTELLPCEPNYYSKRSDYLRHPEFRIDERGRCKRFFKIFRDSGVTQNKHFTEMDFMKSGDRSYIFNKYRTISTGTRDELLGGTDKNSETEITDTVLPFSLPTKNKIELVEEMENLKRQLNKKKYVRLKDDGVLCRL